MYLNMKRNIYRSQKKREGKVTWVRNNLNINPRSLVHHYVLTIDGTISKQFKVVLFLRAYNKKILYHDCKKQTSDRNEEDGDQSTNKW